MTAVQLPGDVVMALDGSSELSREALGNKAFAPHKELIGAAGLTRKQEVQAGNAL